jgi:hypothetical protein
VSNDEIKVYSDVPKGSALAVTSPEQAQALARRMAGILPPDELEFHCMNCGESKTLKFEPEELEALNDDIRSYTGPCWSCHYQMLRPKDAFTGEEPITVAAKKARTAEFKEQAVIQADVLADRMKQEVVSLLGGAPAQATTEPAPPGAFDDLPDAAAVSVDDIKPR